MTASVWVWLELRGPTPADAVQVGRTLTHGSQDSPDESQTGINVRIFPGPLTRQTRGAVRYIG